MRRGDAAALLVCCCACRLALAEGTGADAYDDISKTAPLDVHGLGDVYLLHDFNDPASGNTQLREFDYKSDQPSLKYLLLTLAHRPGRFGFRLDAGIGDTANVYYHQDPAAPNHPDLARGLSYVEQAFVSVMVPLGRELRIDIGRFSTPVGFEDNESLANWNYSRSLLFSWAEPSLHTGLRISCRPNDMIDVSLLWVNGWNSVVIDGSAMRSFAASASWKPSKRVEVLMTYMGGLEHPPTQLAAPLSFRNLLSAYFVCRPAAGTSVALALDYGNDRAEGGVTWWGATGYVRLEPRAWFAATVRGEFLADPDGFVTGTPQKLEEATATLELQRKFKALTEMIRLEYRHDQSNALVFESAVPNARNHQDTISLAVLASF